MIRRPGDYNITIKEHMMGGEGRFVVENLLAAEELHGKGRLFARGSLAPGHTVGWHVHENDMEICYFLTGKGQVRDNDGALYDVYPGDTNIVDAGCGHEIINTGSEDLSYLAVILYN